MSQGARPIPLKPNEEVEGLPLKAARAGGFAVAGVDILKGPKRYLVTRVSRQPGLRGLQTTTRVDIAGKIVNYILNEVRR